MDMHDNNSTSSKLRFVDLFCGLGGTRLGMEQACKELGIKSECVLSSDKKKTAQIAYGHNFGETIEGDICKIDETKIPDFDVLLGGFPCQAFSRAGMRRGFNDTRGTMFFEVERILREKTPKYVLLENVPELLTHDKGNTFRVIRENLEKLGYKVSARVLKGSDFGLAQTRQRTFVTAVLADKPVDMEAIETDAHSHVAMGDIMERGLPLLDDDYTKALLSGRKAEDLAGYIITDKRRGDKTLHSWDISMHGEISEEERHVLETILSEQRKRCWAEELGIRWRDGIPMNKDQISRATHMTANELEPLLDDLTEKGYLIPRHPYCDDSLEERTDLPIGWKLITSRVSFPIHRILGPEDQCITLTATDAEHIGIIDGDGIRKLSLRECLRLFGFPEWYDLSCVSEKKGYDLIGNSICVPVVSAVAKAMLVHRS